MRISISEGIDLGGKKESVSSKLERISTFVALSYAHRDTHRPPIDKYEVTKVSAYLRNNLIGEYPSRASSL